MAAEASLVGKTLTNITRVWTGTVADAIEQPELQQQLPAFPVTQAQSNFTIVIHSAEVIEDGS